MPTQADRRVQTLDLNADQDSIVIECALADEVYIQSETTQGAWTTAVVTLERSISGYGFDALDTPTTITAAGWSEVSSIGFAELRLTVTTVEGSAAKARISTLTRDTD